MLRNEDLIIYSISEPTIRISRDMRTLLKQNFTHTRIGQNIHHDRRFQNPL
jgi:hypothetical protein